MNFHIRRVAVLGAGVMGAQIAAHLANAGVPVVLFDLAAEEGDPNGVVLKALDGLKTLEPSPLGMRERILYIDVANYDQHMEQLRDCDLIIEAIAEKMAWKASLYQRISPYIATGAIFASNTSGLSINALAAVLPPALHAQFCGIHFFNPPRYMSLVEIIPAAGTAPAIVDDLEAWLVSKLGKGVVRAKDTPNFVANRIGVMWLLTVAHHTARLGLSFDEVDALTGARIGLPKSATFRLLDVVGLDTMALVIDNMRAALAGDPWRQHYQVPAYLADLITQGATGQKTKRGLYRREGKETRILDLKLGDYRPVSGAVAQDVAAILKLSDAGERLRQLRASEHPQAQLLWSCYRDLFHYSAYHLADIAHSARDVDFAMRWGYGWKLGPFEQWQAAGWRQVARMVAEDIAAGRAMASAPLPAWVGERDEAHGPEGSWSPAENKIKPRSALPVYRRQLLPERLLGESVATGETLWENAGVRLWRLPADDASVAILSFKSKMHVIGQEVLAGIGEAVRRAEAGFSALVIWHEAPFGAGANLEEIGELIVAQRFDELDRFVRDFQTTLRSVKHAQVPVVAAMQGLALGGVCELAMQCSHRVAAFESCIGLVEAGVGLLPAGGGCATLALEASRIGARQQHGQPNPAVYAFFENISMAKTAKSALEAQSMGFLRESDDIVFNPHELLHVALGRARALAESAYRPPMSARSIPVSGRGGIATLERQMVNKKEGGFISAHDYRIGKAIATALCGGDIEGAASVSEQWLYDVEREQFLALAKTAETQARIAHLLETGKPLRN